MEKSYDVSVIVASYNPDYHKMMKTIKSAVKQKDVDFQIIVCDDGSNNNYFQEIDTYMKKVGFNDYVLVDNPINQGTVINFSAGLKIAKGKYTKGISPGDYFYNSHILSDWVSFLNLNDIDVSFGHSVYYKLDGNKPVAIIRNRELPAIPSIYDLEKNNCWQNELRKVDWLINRDRILGAQIICKTDLCKRYINEIMDIIKYAEDYMFRIMMIDDIRVVHFDEPVLYYEYGEGISSDPDKKQNLLSKDDAAFNEIVRKRTIQSPFSRNYIKLLDATDNMSCSSKKIQWCSIRFFPISFPWKIYKLLYRRMHGSKTYTSIENGFYYAL